MDQIIYPNYGIIDLEFQTASIKCNQLNYVVYNVIINIAKSPSAKIEK